MPTQLFERSRRGEHALLIQPHAGGPPGEGVLEEFGELARSAGATVAAVVTAKIDRPNPATLIGSGKLEEVKAALTEVEVFRLTVLDCQGFGRQKGQTELYRGHEYKVNLLRKVQLQIAVNDDFVEPTINAIIKGGRTGEKGQIGDGNIFVLPMDD